MEVGPCRNVGTKTRNAANGNGFVIVKQVAAVLLNYPAILSGSCAESMFRSLLTSMMAVLMGAASRATVARDATRAVGAKALA